MFRRAICSLVCLLLALAPALSLAEQTFTMAGFDGTDSTHDWATNQFFVRMQERTGISFTFQQYNDRSKWQSAKDEMFLTGALPDVLFKASLTTEELIAYTESGQLIDLLPLLEENAPNLWALFQQNPEWLKAVTLPSGKVGALPTIQVSPPQNALWINQTWLDKLKLSAPTDLASLRNVLTAFLTGDPNENGKQDEIPLTFLGPWELKFFAHAYGVVVNDYNVYLDDDGKVHYWPEENRFFDLVSDLRGMYADGLLDQNGFRTADTLRRVTDEKAAVTYGAFLAPTPVNLVPFAQSVNYVLVEPFVYESKQIYRDLVGPVTRGAFAITSACADPAALLRWIDILYTEEGAVEAMLGKQDENYIVDEDGFWQWKGGLESMTTSVLNELSVYDTGDMPWLFPQAFYERYVETDVRRVSDELNRLDPFIKRPFPVYTLTPEQSAEVLALQNELGPYVDETLARFVMGQLELNEENIAAFRIGLSERGMTEMLIFWQTVADEQGN